MNYYYWQLPDGRIWGYVEGGWVDREAMNTSGILSLAADVDQLRKRIRFYGGDLGELMASAPPLERIAAVQAKYEPALSGLLSAYTSALALSDEEDADEIKADYAALLDEMTQKIAEIRSGGHD